MHCISKIFVQASEVLNVVQLSQARCLVVSIQIEIDSDHVLSRAGMSVLYKHSPSLVIAATFLYFVRVKKNLFSPWSLVTLNLIARFLLLYVDSGFLFIKG